MSKKLTVGRRVLLKDSQQPLVICPDPTDGLFCNSEDAVWVMPYPQRMQYLPVSELVILNSTDGRNLENLPPETVNTVVREALTQMVLDLQNIHTKLEQVNVISQENSSKITKLLNMVNLVWCLAFIAVVAILAGWFSHRG